MAETKWSNLETAKMPTAEDFAWIAEPARTFRRTTIEAGHVIALIRAGVITTKRGVGDSWLIIGGPAMHDKLRKLYDELPD